MKRYISILLCLCMAVGFAMPAFAEEAALLDAADLIEAVSDVAVEEIPTVKEPTETEESESTVGTGETEAGETAEVLMAAENLPIVVSSVTDTVDTGFTWSYENGTLTILGEGAMPDFEASGAPWAQYETEIESVVIGEGITCIGSYAFVDCTALKTLSLPDSLTAVRSYAFWRCTALEDLSFLEGVSSISAGAFSECTGLKNVVIPDGVTYIGDCAFEYCSALESIVLPEGLKTICRMAFCSTALTEVTIPDSVTTLGEGVFYDCGALKSVVLPSGITAVPRDAFQYCTALESVTIPDGITTIGTGAFKECVALTDVEWPESLEQIGSAAFYGCGALKNVVLPDSVRIIDDNAFSNCVSLAWMEMPESLTTVGRNAFSGCSSLASIALPEGMTSIGEKAFYNCTGLKNFRMGSEVTVIGEEAFSGCTALEEITVSDSLVSILANAFSGCSALKSLALPASLKRIGQLAFNNCSSLTDVYYGSTETAWELVEGNRWIPSGCTVHCVELTLPASGTVTNELGQEFRWSIDETGTFTVTGEGEMPEYESVDLYEGNPVLPPWSDYRSMITAVVVGEGITRIGAYSFQKYDGILSVDLPEGLREIGDHAFGSCAGLKAIRLPATLTTLEDYAFYGCALEKLELPAGVIYAGNNVFAGNLALTEVTIAASDMGAMCAYMFQNCTALTTVTVAEGVTVLNSGSFMDCTALKTVSLPSTLETIGSNCFQNCNALTDIKLPDGLKTIEAWAFYGCDLQSFSVPENLETVGNFAYGENHSITAVTIPAGLALGRGAFYECKGIQTVTAEEGVTEVPAECFKLCTALKTVNLASTVETVGDSAFQNCALTKIQFPAGLKTIGREAFYGCDLASIDLPAGLEAIGNGAFAVNERITKAIIPGGVSKIETYIFRGCTGLKSVTLKEGVTFIAAGAFSGCDNLTTLNLPSTIETICWAFELPKLQTMTVAEDPDGLRSFVCWQDESGYLYTTADIVSGVEFDSMIHSVWQNIWIGFEDVREDAWYFDYVKYCYEVGIMAGMGDGTFYPEGGATRAQVVMVLYRLAGEPDVSGGTTFTDVYEGNWYCDAVAWAAENSIAVGYEDGTFAPNSGVTREQFIVFLYRFADSIGLILNDWDELYYLDCSDVDSISDWAMEAQTWSVVVGQQVGYDNGDGTYSLNPKGYITRAELATFLARYSLNVSLYYNAELAESLWGCVAADVEKVFGQTTGRETVSSTEQLWYYEGYGIVLEMLWDGDDQVWYANDWWYITE